MSEFGSFSIVDFRIISGLLMKIENDERGGVEEGVERLLRVVVKVVGSRVEGGEEVEEGLCCVEDGDDVGGKVWRYG